MKAPVFRLRPLALLLTFTVSTLATAARAQVDATPVADTSTPGAAAAVSSERAIEPLIEFAEDGTVTLDVMEMPLAAILNRLASAGGFELVGNAEAEIDLVDLQFESLPWRSAFEDLLWGWRYALTTDEATGRPAKLVLLSFDRGGAPAAPAPQSASAKPASEATPDPSGDRRASLAEATALAAQILARRENPLDARLRAAESARTAILEAIEKAEDEGAKLGADERKALTRRYAESLLALGLHPDPKILSAVEPAVGDASPQVRWAAVRTLREGAVTDAGAPVLSRVRHLITTDPDAEVRREAFEVYARWGDEQDVLSLSKNLGRDPSPVQDLAVREWIRIEREIEERESGAVEAQFQQSQQTTW